MENPPFVHVAVGDHWVKCAQQFENNYAALDGNGNICDPQEAKCVVCGRVASSENCLPSDY